MTAKAAKATTKKTKTTKSKAAVATKPRLSSGKSVAGNSNLRAWNLRLGLVLVLLAVAVIVFGNSHSVPITTQYLAKDALATEAAHGQTVLATATRHLIDVRLSWIVAKSLLVFGAVFLLAASLVRGRYEAWLSRGVNKLRWVGLGLGGGVVVYTVALLSGVSDVSTLCLVYGSVVLAALLVAAVELLGAGRRLRRLLAAGALLAIFVPWLIFVRTLGAVPMWDGSLPVYMYFLYASLTLLLVATGLATYMRVTQKGKWASTLYTEKMFMGLTFLFALLPALQIFAGALQ